MAFNNEIEKVKADIKVLEATLLFLEEREQHRSPEEEGYKRWMGLYPPTTPGVDNINDIRWIGYQKGYDAAKKDWKVGEFLPEPQEPQERTDGSLTDLIWNWWEDVFTVHSDLDAENSIGELVDRIEKWLPKEQSANSQNTYVDCSVEGFNDCLIQIKSKLR